MWTLIVSTVKTQCNFTFYLCYLSVHKSSCIRISVHFLFTYCNFSLKYLDAVWVGTKRLRSFISSVMVVYTITNINCLFWIHVTLFVRTHCFRILMVTTPDFHHCCFQSGGCVCHCRWLLLTCIYSSAKDGFVYWFDLLKLFYLNLPLM